MQQLEILCYGLILLFGIAVSVRFSGAEQSRKNILGTIGIFVFTLFAQIICRQLVGLENTKELYPLIVHLPLIIFLVVFLKRTWLVAVSSVFFRLFVLPDSEVVCFNRGSNLSDKKRFLHHLYTHNGSYLFLFEKICCYTGRQDDEPVEEILFAVWSRPVFYYIFDYVSTIYTDWLYSGSK